MVLLPFIKNKRKLLWPVTMMVIYSNHWEKGTGLPDRGPEEINTMGVYSLHAFGDLLKQNRLWWPEAMTVYSIFWEASKIHTDKFWWREMEQNVQREFIVKSFKKPVEITLKFYVVTYCPQSTMWNLHNANSCSCM